MTAIARWLAGSGAQRDAVAYFEPYGADWTRAWADLPRGDWMLGIAARFVDDAPALARAAASCARVALRFGGTHADAAAGVDELEFWAARGGSTSSLSERATRLEAASERAQSLAERSALLATAAALRAPSEPEQAALAVTYAIEAALDARSDEDPMRLVAEVQRECADAARIHLPAQLVKSPFRG